MLAPNIFAELVIGVYHAPGISRDEEPKVAAALQRHIFTNGIINSYRNGGDVFLYRRGRGFQVTDKPLPNGKKLFEFSDSSFMPDMGDDSQAMEVVNKLRSELPKAFLIDKWMRLRVNPKFKPGPHEADADYPGIPMTELDWRRNLKYVMAVLNRPLSRYVQLFDYDDKRPRKPVRSGTGDFVAFHSNPRAESGGPDALKVIDIPEHGTLASRRWGIEVEAAGARYANTPTGWNRKYDSSLDSAYDGYDDDREPDLPEPEEPEIPEEVIEHRRELIHHQEGWIIGQGIAPNPAYVGPEGECEECMAYYDAYEQYERDLDEYESSRSDNEGSDEDTGEFVSPILRSVHSRGLETLLEELNAEPQNDTAGIHVHVEIADLTPKQIGSLLYGYNLIEPIIEEAYNRDVRGYCKRWSLSNLRTSLASAKRARNVAAIESGDRYVSLNLCAISAHGTVEFRGMGPVYEYEHLIRWAIFCREMVNVARSGVKSKEWNAIRTIDDLRDLFLRRGKELVATRLGQLDVPTVAPYGIDDMSSEERAEFNASLV